jgi:hypothetical protein
VEELGIFILFFLFFIFIFFDKSEEYIKKRRGAQPLVHREYTKGRNPWHFYHPP